MGQIIVPGISDRASIPIARSQMVPDQHEHALRADLNLLGCMNCCTYHILCAEGLLNEQDIVVARGDWSSSPLPLLIEEERRKVSPESFDGIDLEIRNAATCLTDSASRYTLSTMSQLSRGARAAVRSTRRFVTEQPRRFESHHAPPGSGESALHVEGGGTGKESFGVCPCNISLCLV
jgi:hypothetical protein